MFYFYPIRLRTNRPKFIVPMLIKIVTLTVILFSVTPGIATADKKTPGQGIPLQSKKMVGDFDEMVQHRRIRALVTYSKTFSCPGNLQQNILLLGSRTAIWTLL